MALRKKQILDPLWITKGSFLDPEYFSYVLLAASQKYKKDLEEGDLRYFYEIFFHSLNLNNLAIDGSLFDSKLHPIWNSDRLKKIKQELRNLFEGKNDVVEIFRNANYVFLNLILDYMDQQLSALDLMEIFYLNEMIHEQEEIFIVMNRMGSKKYSIWQLNEDPRKDYGFSFKKIKTFTIENLRDNALKDKIREEDHPVLNRMKENTNVMFVVAEELDPGLTANVIKDTILLNKGIAKGISFEPTIAGELYGLLSMERLMPFTLNQWID
jgi:hypothetical protein